MTIKISSLQEILLKIFIVSVPFYTFSSGLPQFADYIMAILIFITLTMNKGSLSILSRNRAFKYFMLFVIYTFLINGIWALILSDLVILRNSIFYLFNVLLFGVIYFLGITNLKIIYIIVRYVGYTLILLMILAFTVVDISGYRQTLFFNNPNQLGYFALVYLAIFLLGATQLKLKQVFIGSVQAAGFVLVLLSLSSAAIIGAALLIFVYYSYYFKKYWLYFALIIISLTIAYEPLKNTDLLGPIISNAEHRITTIGQSSDDNFTGRGYDRMINEPFYLVLGAGEGQNIRFDSVLTGEMHSSWGVLIFSYGIPGTLFFALALKQIFTPVFIIYFIPIFFYGLTHQGLRSTQLWVFLALFMVINNRFKEGTSSNESFICSRS